MADKNDQKADELKQQPAEEASADEPKAQPAESQASEGEVDQHGRQLFTVVCSNCGNEAKVPFKPADGRPVYCRDCYMQQRRERRGGGGFNRGGGGPRR